MKDKQSLIKDYIKTNRKANREVEIEYHGKPIQTSKIQQSKKVYNRNKMKADAKRHLPSDFLYTYY